MPKKVLAAVYYEIVLPDDAQDNEQRAHIYGIRVRESLQYLEVVTSEGNRITPTFVDVKAVGDYEDDPRYLNAVAIFGKEFVRVNPMTNVVEFYSHGANIWRPWSF